MHGQAVAECRVAVKWPNSPIRQFTQGLWLRDPIPQRIHRKIYEGIHINSPLAFCVMWELGITSGVQSAGGGPPILVTRETHLFDLLSEF